MEIKTIKDDTGLSHGFLTFKYQIPDPQEKFRSGLFIKSLIIDQQASDTELWVF